MRTFLRRAAQAPPRFCVFRWDLDKTYLKTEFDRVRDLVRTAFEKATDKVAAPGVATLIRSLRRVAEEQGREVRVFFLTASPPQIGRAIREKLALDGIVHDGIVFKDQLQNLLRGRFANLREQVGFKLTELLASRGSLPEEAVEFLFGDDWESDPLAYSLYADIVSGRVEAAEVEEVLRLLGVDPELRSRVIDSMRTLPRRDAVRRIFIHLERRTPPANLRSFGSRLVPTFNYFQTAVCLRCEGVMDDRGVAEVGRALVAEAGYDGRRLANSLADLLRRGHVSRRDARRLARSLVREGLFRRGELPEYLAGRWAALREPSFWKGWFRAAAPPPALPPIDYRSLAAELRAAR